MSNAPLSILLSGLRIVMVFVFSSADMKSFIALPFTITLISKLSPLLPPIPAGHSARNRYGLRAFRWYPTAPGKTLCPTRHAAFTPKPHTGRPPSVDAAQHAFVRRSELLTWGPQKMSGSSGSTAYRRRRLVPGKHTPRLSYSSHNRRNTSVRWGDDCRASVIRNSSSLTSKRPLL